MKKIIIASSNHGKIKEFKALLQGFELFSLDEFFKGEIEENGLSFKENALIKARAIYNSLEQKDKKEFIVLSDDSGLCVEALAFRPGIFSARFSGQKDDGLNRKKLLDELSALKISKSKAYFKSVIALCSFYGECFTNGLLRGYVIDKELGENGFGYDCLFVPNSYDKTLAQLSFEEKNLISHRKKALENMEFLLRSFREG